ncbi:Phage-related protein [Pseudomonas luteola]|uniref:Phage-related protein n=1 Tax=Pseudomonas luteola TaxID=47886 RepID=A0A2X2E4E0_PSELU|nr:type II toxin-antitoxin system RelE/ParE family toxin [Pseudomonas luteola]SPZ01720.1 Phage-related protein [Pseudomonas luteola]
MNENETKKEVRFSSQAAEKAYSKLPEDIRIVFMHNLDMVSYGMRPGLPIDHLTSVDAGVIELKINGSPAYRCVYYTKLPGQVVVVHAFAKTSEDSDTKNLATAKRRVQDLKAENNGSKKSRKKAK